MRFGIPALFLLVLAASAFPFSIDSYYTHATVQADGSIEVSENINFTLEQEYNEGFRTIRKEDFGTLDNIIVRSVKVNGGSVQYAKQLNGEGQAEIVWKKTYAGQNNVEIAYTLKDRAQLYNDFAKVCFEHYGAGWSVPASKFKSVMSLPEASRGKDMHFEVYSSKKGDARIDDLSVVIEMNDVPPGNYVGGCYLYDRGALHTLNLVNASALAILQDERKAYGSQTIVGPDGDASEQGSSACCCLPLGIFTAIAALYFLIKDMGLPRKPESILPPDNEEPAVVTAIVRNKLDDSDILASTILDLINRNCLDIVELEKKGETSAEVKREHTILFLKRRPDAPKPYETAVLDMLFPEGKKEVDLDQMAADYDAIKDKASAEKSPVARNIEIYTSEIEKILKAKGVWDIRNAADGRNGIAALLGFIGMLALCGTLFVNVQFVMTYLAAGNYLEVAGTALGTLLFFPALGYLMLHYRKPSVPDNLRDEFGKWDAFARAVKSSRLKEYPPSSAVIWGEILVYATALGMADKVKRHMSELDAITAKRLENLEVVGVASRNYFTSAWALHNLKRYGDRSGPASSHGGFSSHSSGGWSSGGGGGFSSGSSGGGGFR
jgi:uncharacterized membrane protein